MGAKKAAKAAAREAEAARAEEAARQQRVRDGTQRIGDIFDAQFTEDYFNGQRDRYVNYAMPQVDDQFEKAGKDLLFATDRSGQTEGSARADLSSELQQRYDLQTQKVRDDGLAYSTDARTAVEGARNDLVGMVNATGDVDGAVNSAMSRASTLSQPVAYSPIGSLFADFTSALGTQAAAERAFAYGGPRPGTQTGIFAPRSGAVAIT